MAIGANVRTRTVVEVNKSFYRAHDVRENLQDINVRIIYLTKEGRREPNKRLDAELGYKKIPTINKNIRGEEI
jgi:hypothetical protein